MIGITFYKNRRHFYVGAASASLVLVKALLCKQIPLPKPHAIIAAMIAAPTFMF
jgi:hypothetical protein